MLDEAVRVATEMTDEDDTLMIVTADHSHVFNIAGYPKRGNDILGYKIVGFFLSYWALLRTNLKFP